MQPRFVIAVVVAAACGSSDNPKPSVSANKDNVCNQIADVACYDLYQCCSEGQIERYLNVADPRTEDQCKSDVTRLCEQKIGTVDSSIQAGKVTFDSSTMNACLKALLPPDNECSSVSTMLPWAAACMDSAWVGTVAVGGMCSYPFECAGTDVYCAANQTCTMLPGNNMACSAAGCATGFYCGGGTCRAQGAVGAMCQNARQCAKGLYCDQNSNMCATLQGPGQACTGNEACQSNQCLPGTCSGSTQLCFIDGDCGGTCSNNGQTCQRASDCGQGACSVGGATCQRQTDCTGTGNTCVFPNQCNGASCVGPVVCSDMQVSVDYCTGAVSSLPTPP
jgi:hypothetical protein